MRHSPTSSAIARGRSAVKKKRPRRPKEVRRVRQEPPDIYVRLGGESHYGAYSHAHLRNKKGYVYLCWRDGDRVRNFYLGKAPRKSPTPADPAAP